MTTAKILQFPVGGRAAWTSQRSHSAQYERDSLFAAEMPRIANVASGGAWYHEQAMAEETSEGKR
ncbi:MAG: DUF2735 domain-containing protein [Nitratireductor sp.]|nr:DUF2735 domain-containing protein [Nitratireductor sp.]